MKQQTGTAQMKALKITSAVLFLIFIVATAFMFFVAFKNMVAHSNETAIETAKFINTWHISWVTSFIFSMILIGIEKKSLKKNAIIFISSFILFGLITASRTIFGDTLEIPQAILITLWSLSLFSTALSGFLYHTSVLDSLIKEKDQIIARKQ